MNGKKFPLFLWTPYYDKGAMVVIKSVSITASSNHSQGLLGIDWDFNDPNMRKTLAIDERMKIEKYITKYVMDYLK